MNCEHANNLISARIDGELTGDDRATLDGHLAECETCRQTMAEMELTDAALLRAFSPRREAAAELAGRVSQTLSQAAIAARPAHAGRFTSPLLRWSGFAAAAAIGFITAMVVVKPDRPRPIDQHPFVDDISLQPVAHLTLATGAVFTCPVNQQTWRSVSPHDPIALGAAIRTTEASKCELQLPDGSCVRLNSGTEAKFTGNRTVQVSTGQVWSGMPRNAAPICVSAGETSATAGGAGNDHGAEFEMACVANTATVTVQRGAARVAGNVPSTTVHGGEILRAPSPTAAFACTAMPDPRQATQWQDELLVLKSADDPEVVARIDWLITRIATDGASAGSPCPAEREIREGGQAWCTPMACYIHNQPKTANPGNRRTAARILADLAPRSSIPDLIELLADDDNRVRFYMANALYRLTGQTLGYTPDYCAAHRDPASAAAWNAWWEDGKVGRERVKSKG